MSVTPEELQLVRTWLKSGELSGAVSRRQDLEVLNILQRMVAAVPMPDPDYVPFHVLGKMYDVYMKHDDAYLSMREAYRFLYDHYNASS